VTGAVPTGTRTRGVAPGKKRCVTTTPENPFAATDAGTVYARGRPYHHPRSLARIRALVGDDPVVHAADIACGTGLSTIALAEHATVVSSVYAVTAIVP